MLIGGVGALKAFRTIKMAKVDLLRAICSKGGMISSDDLEDMGLAPLKELNSIITQNPDTFTEVVLGGRKFVTARSDISLCETPDCMGCQCLHMCQGYMLGNCNDTGCPFSHDLCSPHNIWVLKQHGLNGLKEHEISILLFHDEPPPQPAPRQACPRPAPRQVHLIRKNPATDDAVLQIKQESLGSDAICQMHLIHRCVDGGQCGEAHRSVPYLWQKRDGSQWRALPNNEETERDYCNPAKTIHGGTPPVDFDLMCCGSAEVRRLSVTSPGFHTASLLVTRWAWYWEQAEDQWKEYGPPEGKADKLAMTSELLELKYQEGVPSFKFAYGQNTYFLSFADMIQTNLTTEMKRLVRRRPVLISQAEVQKVCEKYSKRLHSNFLSSVPEHWNHSLLPGTGYERIKLETSSQEYRRVLHQFNQTMARCNILSVERLQNLKLWRSFMLQKNQMKNEAGKEVPVKRLFHGVESEYINAICHGNVDWAVSGLKDTRFGKGCCFARDASYANKYTDRHRVRTMFLCCGLVGDSALGQPDYNKPPFKDEKKTVSFDSCVDDLTQPSVYVIFERNQTYPEYLIQYEIAAEVESQHNETEPIYELVETQPVPVVSPLPSRPKSKRCGCDCNCVYDFDFVDCLNECRERFCGCCKL